MTLNGFLAVFLFSSHSNFDCWPFSFKKNMLGFQFREVFAHSAISNTNYLVIQRMTTHLWRINENLSYLWICTGNWNRNLRASQIIWKDLVVLDDLICNAGDSKQRAQLFTQDAHHKNLSVIFIVQNLFYQWKEMRPITLNADYIILYKHPRYK